MTEELPFCECGCGERVAKGGNRFILNHDKRKPKPVPKLCKCGCGGYANPGNRFIFGHQSNGECNTMYGMSGEKSPVWGRKHTEDEKEKIRIATSGESNHNFGKHLSEETKKSLSIVMKNGFISHHYIYDHANPELYTTNVPRSKHNQIHGWLRKAKILVPHINVTEENENIFKDKKR